MLWHPACGREYAIHSSQDAELVSDSDSQPTLDLETTKRPAGSIHVLLTLRYR